MALQGMKTVTEIKKKNETILILLNINAIKLNPVKLRDNDQILVCLEIQQQMKQTHRKSLHWRPTRPGKPSPLVRCVPVVSGPCRVAGSV